MTTPEASEVGKTFVEKMKKMTKLIWSEDRGRELMEYEHETLENIAEAIIIQTLAEVERVVEGETPYSDTRSHNTYSDGKRDFADTISAKLKERFSQLNISSTYLKRKSNMNLSESFEGEDSSLKKAFDQAGEAAPSVEEDRDELKGLEAMYMSLKDDYSELARALGFEGASFWGDPLVSHAEVLARAKTLSECLCKDKGVIEMVEEARDAATY